MTDRTAHISAADALAALNHISAYTIDFNEQRGILAQFIVEASQLTAERDEAIKKFGQLRESLKGASQACSASEARATAAESQLAAHLARAQAAEAECHDFAKQLAALRGRLDLYEEAHRNGTLHRVYHSMPAPEKR